MPGKIQAITLCPKPSRKLYIWLMAIHLLALTVTLFAPLVLWHKLVLLLCLALYGYLSYRQARRRSGKRILAARIAPGGRSRITMGDGRKLLARVRRDSLITPWLILLRFDLGRGWSHPSLVLTADCLSEEEMRQLRVLLRFSEVNKSTESLG